MCQIARSLFIGLPCLKPQLGRKGNRSVIKVPGMVQKPIRDPISIEVKQGYSGGQADVEPLSNHL